MDEEGKWQINLEGMLIDATGCFGVGISKPNSIDLEKFDKMTWRKFLSINKQKKLKGEWFYDGWLIEKIRSFLDLFEYHLSEVRVYMPKNEFPLYIVFEAYRNNGCILLSPRRDYP